jgi:hypothetical protein
MPLFAAPRPPPLWRGGQEAGAIGVLPKSARHLACHVLPPSIAATATAAARPSGRRSSKRRSDTAAAAPASAAAASAAAATPAAASSSAAADADAAIAAAKKLYEVAWTKGDIRVLDTIMAADHVQNDAVWQPAEGGRGSSGSGRVGSDASGQPSAADGRRAATAGRDRLKRGILAYRAAYPDVAFEVLSCAATQVPSSATTSSSSSSSSTSSSLWRVFVHWRASGTNTGPIRDAPPSGRRVEFSGVNVATVRVDADARAELVRSDVYRQAPADEAAYFLSRGAVVGVGGGGGGER